MPSRINRDLLKRAIRENIETLCRHFFPNGKKAGQEWRVGNLQGEVGRTLNIHLEGDKAGIFQDFNTGEHGDFVMAIKIARGVGFVEAALEIGRAIGISLETGDSTSATGSSSRRTTGTRYTTGASVRPCDWDKDYQLSETDLKELATWRGYSISFCSWVSNNRLIGRQNGLWAFPVRHDGIIVSAHVRQDKNKWIYRPRLKDIGVDLSPLVIGDLANAEKIFSAESQWDVFSLLDKLGVQHGEAIAGIATRGAQNGTLVGSIEIKAELYLVPQNDDAGRAWLEHAAGVLSCRMRILSVPSTYHDVGDWLRAIKDIAEIVEAIRNAKKRDPNKPKTKAERLEIFSLAAISGTKFLDVQIPAKEIIIEDWLKEGEVGFVYAYRGTGKTWLILSLCIAIAEGTALGPWNVPVAYPVLYLDGEMAHDDNSKRIIALCGKIPGKLHILNHEVLFCQGALVMNLANRTDQEIVLELCLARKIKVLVVDNLSCLFTGVDENDASEWEKVKPWLLELRRHGISPIVVHHTGYDQTRMRGTSSREDAASWVLRLDNKKDDFDQPGANFISRFTKYRGRSRVLDYEWHFDQVGESIKVSYGLAGRGEVFLQWIRDGLTRCEDIAKEMGISKGRASQIAAQLIKLGQLRKKGREYEAI
jgi:putative DNA primase/helicase